MIAAELLRLADSRPLSARDARCWFDALTRPSTTDLERASLLVAMRARPETARDLTALARAMRRRARPFPIAAGRPALDLCGSGGAPFRTFNVSTVAAFVVAAAGVPVVKHGNRSARGPCGSTDLLEALGLPVAVSRAFSRASYRRYRIAFLHAPLFHPATASVAAARRALGVPTVFNRLGPLVHPARIRRHLVGAPDRETADRLARALRALGVTRGAAVTSEEGADEFSPRRVTILRLWSGPRLRWAQVAAPGLLDPDERRGSWKPLAPPAAAEETCRLLAGGGGARRGSVLLTAAAGLWIAGRTDSLRAAMPTAREALDSGRAERLLGALQSLAHGRKWAEDN